MCRKIKRKAKSFGLIVITVFLMCGLWGCKTTENNLGEVDFTVVPKEDIPEELLQRIEMCKNEEFTISYTEGENTYISVGYGEQKSSGYSVVVDEFYETEESLVISTNLITPEEDENVFEETTCPYIVVMVEATEKMVEYK
jgi:hypothetical protein